MTAQSLLLVFLLSVIVTAQSFVLSPLTANARSKFITRKSMVECPAGEFDMNVIEQSSNSLVVVDFYAEWCGPCKLVSPIFQSLAEELTDIKFVKVDTDKHEDRIDSFNIQGLPLFGIFKHGKMIASHSGALSKDNLRKFINKSAELSQ